MRISDWSSDVCSSDLAGSQFAISADRNRPWRDGRGSGGEDDGALYRLSRHPGEGRGSRKACEIPVQAGMANGIKMNAPRTLYQKKIGRESGRERVWKNV